MNNRHGQVLIILLFFIPPLLFLLFSVANTTLAVRDRIKLQNSADAAALSAAAWQAKGLNQLAEANTVIETIELMKRYVALGKAQTPQVRAKLLLLEAEKQQMGYAKDDILKRMPAYARTAAVRNGGVTLTGGPLPVQGADFGAAAFGVQRGLALALENDGSVEAEKNRIFGVAWRKRTLAGAARHVFGKMAVPPGFALSSARAESGRNSPGHAVLVPDFRPALVRVQLAQEDFDYLKNNYFFAVGETDYHELSENILH